MIKKFIPQSLKNLYHLLLAGVAVAVFGKPGKSLTIIGVTGTDGKTTTSTILYHILNAAGLKVALISTVAAYIGDTELDTGFHVTSPDPWALQKLLKEIKDSGFEYVVLEATSHGLDQHRLFGTAIKVGVLTNITHEHLDYHKTYERYVAAKAKLFTSAEVAILNKSDKSYSYIKKLLPTSITKILYDEKTLNTKLLRIVTRVFKESYNQLNATAAIQVAQYLGIDENKIIKGLEAFPGIPGRMERIPNKKGITAIVDFAHTPNGLENALSSLKPQTKGKLIAVYGSAGLRDFEKRPIMGKIGAKLADEVILTAEDPRTESVWDIFTQMTSNISENVGHVHKIADRAEAINFAVKLAKPGDTVVVLGKGHEKSMCFGKTEYPWSDQETLSKALKKKK